MNDIDAHMEARERRRFREEAAAVTRMERQERAAAPLIGELQGEAGFRYYINLLDRKGRFTGKIKESRSYHELVDYLVRNRYI